MSVESPKEALVDDPDEMFLLADLLEGVSVDCADLSSETLLPGIDKQDSFINCIFFLQVQTVLYLLKLCCFAL